MVLSGVGGLAAALGLGSLKTARAGDSFPIQFTDAEWRKRLTPQQYAVLRLEGTERPYSSPLNDEHRRGTFACAGCDNELFASTTKNA